METRRFSEYGGGTLHKLLIDAYSEAPELIGRYSEDWKAFDSFVYDNLSFMDECGFITIEDNNAVGFMSWDPRNLPDSVEIGHNCIAKAYQGFGKGREQLLLGIDKIKSRKPKRIIAKTGHIDFFIPAQRMYLSAGFKHKKSIKRNDDLVAEAIEYELEIW
jgi:Acetyltransferase (GNAT) family